MDVEKLKDYIETVFSSASTIQVYMMLKHDDEFVLKLANLEDDKTEPEVRNLFEGYVKDVILANEVLEICELSKDDERVNAIYHYDYNEYPEELSLFKSFNIKESAESYDKFNFNEDDLKNLYGYIIYIGNMNEGIVLFKKHYAITLIKRDSFLLGLKKSKERFELVSEDDMLRLNGDIQLMIIAGEMFVLDTKILTQNMKFNKLITKAADETIDAIAALGLLEDVQVLRDTVEDFSFARRLSKVKKTSPIFELGIPKETIVEFTKRTSQLAGRFKYSDDGQTIRLDTKKSKDAFIKLMNDSFLRSELTNQYYETSAKDKI